MSRGKEMQAVVSIAGTIDPSLNKSIASAQKSLRGVHVGLKAIGAVTIAGAVAGVAAIGTAAVVTAKKLYDIGKKFDDASDKIRIGTGAVGKDLDDLNQSFKNVYKNVDSESGDVAQAIADINTLTGAKGKVLEEVAEKSLKAAKMLGIDSASITSSASKAFNAFNVKGMEMSETLDYVWKVSQSTGTGMDKLMQTVVDNSSTFKNLKYDMKGAVALVGKLDKAGIETTKVFAGMTKGATFFADKGFKSAAQGFSAYSKKIKGAKSETEAFKIASEVFGKRGAGVMVQAIRSGAIEAGDFMKSMDQSSETIKKSYKDISDLGEVLEEIWHKIEVFLSPIGKVLFDQFQQIGEVLGEQLEKWEPQITATIQAVVPEIQKWTDVIIGYVKKIDFNKILDAMKVTCSFVVKNWKLIAGILGGVVVVALVAVIAAIGWIPIAIGAVVAALAWLWNSWGDIEAAFIRVNNWLTEKLGGWKYLILGLINPIGAVALYCMEHWEEVSSFFSSVWEIIKNVWNTGCDILFRLWNACFKLVTAIFREVLAAFGVDWEEFQAYWQAGVEVIKLLWKSVCDYFTSENSRFVLIAGAIKTAFISAFQGVKDFVMGVIIYIKAQFESLISTITGFTAGIKGMGGSIRKAFQAVNPFGGSDSALPAKAAGGFVNGPSLCGEAGTEAVISFDPRYREANRGYLMTAAEMLGMASSPAETNSRQNVVNYDLGGITFSPVIKSGSQGEAGTDIIRQLKAVLPEFVDMIEEALKKREDVRYGV